MMKEVVLTVLNVLCALTLAACAPSVTSLSPEDGSAYAAEVDEYVESFLIGISECDFDMTHRGFNPEWEIDERTWQQECEPELAVRGAYQSKTLDHVEVRPGIHARVVIYHVVFENDPDVDLEMYFSDDPNHLIVGIDWPD
jgi:hypothetical protein